MGGKVGERALAGPDWWQAGDGRWYPREENPANAVGTSADEQRPRARQWIGSPDLGRYILRGGRRFSPVASGVAFPVVLAVALVGGALHAVLHGTSASSNAPAPTVTGSGTVSAPDQAAQGALASALFSARELYEQGGSTFSITTPAKLEEGLRPLTVVGGDVPSTSPTTISLATTGQAALLTTSSSSGECWWMLDVETSAPGVGAGLPTAPGTYYAASAGPSCLAYHPPSTGWQPRQFPIPG